MILHLLVPFTSAFNSHDYPHSLGSSFGYHGTKYGSSNYRSRSYSNLRRYNEHGMFYDEPYSSDTEDRSLEIHALDREIELQELKGSLPNSKRDSVQEVDDGTSQIELKFTNLSQESNVSDYKRKLTNSKIFKFTAKADTVVNIILVSTTKFYHPQLIFSEQNDSGFTELNNGKVSTKFNCSKSKSYVAEVGFDKNLDTDPFRNINSGSFVLIISSTALSIRETMIQESIKVSIWGYDGVVPFEHDESLNLYHATRKQVNHGFLNYQITPFCDSSKKSISLYYHRGVDVFSGKDKRSSTVEIVCNENVKSGKLFFGKEPSVGKYEYEVESKRICDLIELIGK